MTERLQGLSKQAVRVLVTDPMEGLVARLGRDPLAPLRSRAELIVCKNTQFEDSQALKAALSDSVALLCVLTDRVDAEMIATAPHLRVISTVSVGVDHIDLAAASARGIPVTNTPGVLVETTAELTLALLLSVTRRVAEGDRAIRAGNWTQTNRWQIDGYLGRDLSGSTLGILGLGPIGRAVAARARAFGLNILGWSRSDREVPGVVRASLEQVLADSDFLSLHVASTAETRHLIDAVALRQMKPGAILINTARGDVVDEVALVEALQSGRVAGAGLDVFAQEPLPVDHPLLKMSSVVLTPHVGSATAATRMRMVDLAVANVMAVLDGGRPLNCVNPQVWGGASKKV